ncbi:MAG: amino acid-binding protein [Lachnospiraceae bacterium]|nr:amino acid-binding protein [Lachnospiraceae bacterium]
MDNTIKQLSIFVENREGQLDDVLKVLADNDVNIVAASLADTSDYGMLRLIVSDPEKGREALKNSGMTAMLTDVIALRVPHTTGSLSKAIHGLVAGSINIEYMYAFANGADAAAVLKSDDPEKAINILKATGFDVFNAKEAYESNIVK